MKISAPSLKLDLAVTEIVVRDGKPVVLCRVGAYDATAILSRNDVIAFVKALFRPKVLWVLVRMLVGK